MRRNRALGYRRLPRAGTGRFRCDPAADPRCPVDPPMPLIVLTADQPTATPPGALAGFGAVIEHAHHAAQGQVAQLAPGAKWITDTRSGHNMMFEQPQLVSDAIVQVMQAVRDGRTSISG